MFPTLHDPFSGKPVIRGRAGPYRRHGAQWRPRRSSSTMTLIPFTSIWTLRVPPD
jgi:hypothetical protein